MRFSNIENRVTIFDWAYDNVAQDWQLSGGDLVLISDPQAVLSQAIIDAMECQWNSMPYVLPNWGYEGRDDTYELHYLSGQDLARRKINLYLKEILSQALGRFIRTITYITIAFPSDTSFTARIELIMSDMAKTSYDHQLQWDATTKRASIT